MWKLFRQNFSFIKRQLSTCDDSVLTQRLKERTLLRLSGKDANTFLQGLITNDMKHFEDGASSMFTMFLNSKGRVLYDSIIYKTENDNTYLIECDTEACSLLKDHLMRYKVRRKVNIDSLKDELDVWSVINNKAFQNTEEVSDYKKMTTEIKQNLPQLVVSSDPRLSTLGLRIITPKGTNLSDEIEKNIGIKTRQENFYKLLRYKLGIGEGLQELPPEKCFPMEANGDYLHGISFHKGCYIGQELTARTYHTGVIRKRLMPLMFSEEIKINEPGVPIFAISELNKSIGKLKGVEQTTGVGLLRIEEALKAEELVVSDAKCKTHRPSWWPHEAPKERLKIG